MAIKVLNNYLQEELMIFKKVCKTLEQLYIYIYIYTTIIDKESRNPCRNSLKICSGSAIFFGSQIVVFQNLLLSSFQFLPSFTVSISNELNWLPRTNRSSLNRTRKSPVPSGKETQHSVFLLLFLNAFDVAFIGKREKPNGRQIIFSNQLIKANFFRQYFDISWIFLA